MRIQFFRTIKPFLYLLLVLALVGCSSSTGSSQQGSSSYTSQEASSSATMKRGIAYGHHSKADQVALSLGVRWWYNWTNSPDESLGENSPLTNSIEYVPMVWGEGSLKQTSSFTIPTASRFLLAFNEPNFKSQANMTAQDAAALWPQLEAIADAHHLQLVSPAVNFCGPESECNGTNPFDYLDSYFLACINCRVDKIAIHIYVGCNQNGSNKAQWLINHIQTYKQRFTQPLWLTEFACTDAKNMEEQIAFLKDAISYLDGEPRIERYAWFSGRFDDIPYVNLLGDDGELTELGKAYVY